MQIPALFLVWTFLIHQSTCISWNKNKGFTYISENLLEQKNHKYQHIYISWPPLGLRGICEPDEFWQPVMTVNLNYAALIQYISAKWQHLMKKYKKLFFKRKSVSTTFKKPQLNSRVPTSSAKCQLWEHSKILYQPWSNLNYITIIVLRMENWMRKSSTECRAGGRTGRECLECCATGKWTWRSRG